MSFYKVGSNMAEEIATEMDRAFLLEAFKKMYRIPDNDRVKELVRLKLQTPEGFLVMSEQLGLNPQELVTGLMNTFPDMFSHKFCKFLRNSYFDKRCETCKCFMPRKGVCKTPDSTRQKAMDKDTKGCKKWLKR